jgi:hypothetical protein
MTDVVNPFEDCCTIIHCAGAAKPTDTHLASIIHCVDEEILKFLKRREARRQGGEKIK